MDSKIIEGENAAIGRYPYMVSIQLIDSIEYDTNIFIHSYFEYDYFAENGTSFSEKSDKYFEGNDLHICGGSLISSRAVLTSAVCVDRVNTANFQVVIGCDDISKDANCTIASIQEAVIHPSFSIDQTDLGIIILDEPVSNPTIPLAFSNFTIQNGEAVRHIGYGATLNLNTPPRAQLQEINLEVVENEVCINQLEDVFYSSLSSAYDFSYAVDNGNLETVFCAVGNGESGCEADFGGPVLYPCDSEDVEDIQLGVFSFTFKCLGDGIPMGVEPVFSETAFEFIQSVIQNFTLDDVQFIETTETFCPEFSIEPVIPPTPFPTFDLSQWKCGLVFFASSDGCDCNCGLHDPDCEISGHQLFNCHSDEQCVEGICVAAPTESPTVFPSISPTINPSISPTFNPSFKPTTSPTLNPSDAPTTNPTAIPTVSPTLNPSFKPTSSPTLNPTLSPTIGEAPFVSTQSILLVTGSILVSLVVLAVVLRQREQKKEARMKEMEEENKNLMIIRPKQKYKDVPTAAEFPTLPQDGLIALSSEISEVNTGEPGGIRSLSTFNYVPKTLTNQDGANHLKIRGVISKHTKYAQVVNMMLELNNLAQLKGETRTTSFIDGVVSLLSNSLVENGDQVDDQLSEFDAEVEPDISLSIHLLRLIEGVNFWYEPNNVWNSTIGIQSLLLALHLLRRMKYLLAFKTTILNIHKTFSILVLLSTKFIVDRPFSNSYWATISGVEADEISKLEDILCFLVGFDFSIDKIELGKSLRPYESFAL